MAKTSDQISVQILMDGNRAINTLDKIKKSMENLDKEAKKLAKPGKNQDLIGAQKAKEEADGLRKAYAQIRKEVQDTSKAFSTAGKSVAGLENALKLATEKYRRLSNEADRNKMAIRIRQIKEELNRMNSSLDVANTKSSAFGRLAQLAAEYTGMYMLINRSRQIVTNAIQGNLALSDSISDIQKVSGLSEEAVKGLVGEIEKLDSRNAPSVLNNMAYAAGKLGIKGAENLLGFTRAADKLNVALKEYLGDGADGVVSLMKFANVMGTTEKYGVEQALIKTGSALNYMTQSTAAAADYMIEFASRFGPIARQARMTSGDVIGLASALDALAVNNEEAATSLQKFVIKVLSSPVHVAKALGMDADAAKEMVETGKSIELVEMALAKLGERAEKYGVSGITSVIGDIGSKGQAQRLIKTLATLANNTQMVGDYVTMANKAFTEGTSVIDEYNIKNQNAAAIMERMKNSWQKVLVNAEQVGIIKQLAEEFYIFSQRIQQTPLYMNAIKGTFVVIIESVKTLIRLLPTLLPLLMAMGSIKLIQTLGGWAQALGASVKALWGYITAIRTAETANEAFAISATKTGWGALLVVIGLVVAKIAEYISEQNEANRKATEFNKTIKNLTESTEDFEKELYKEARQMNSLFDQLKAANEGTDRRRQLIAELNTKYGQYLSSLLTEKNNINEIKKAQEEANEALKQNIALRVKKGKIEELYTAFAKKGSKGLELFRSGVEKTGLGAGDIANAQETIKALLKENYGKQGYGGPNQATVSILKELAKTDSRWNFVLNNRKDVGSIYDFMRESKKRGIDYYGNNHIDEGRRAAAYKREQEMVHANQEAYKGIYDYVLSVIEVTNAEKKLNERYAPMIGDLEDRLRKQEEDNNQPTTTETLEDFSKEQKEAEMEKKRLEAEMKKKMDEEHKGLKALIEAFYNTRAAYINNLHEEGEIATTMERDQWLEANEVMKAEAINNAWKYLLGDEGGKKLWEAQFQQMTGQIIYDMKDFGVQMEMLMNLIGRQDMEGLANLLKNFGSKLSGEMRNTIAKNDKLIAESGSKVWEEFEKTLDKHDYEEVVRKKFWGLLNQLHLFRTQYEDGMTEGFDNATDAALAGIDELAGKYDMLFAINIKTAEGMEQFKQMLSSTSVTSHQMAQMADADLERLYYVMVTLGEEMSNANKKWVEFQKKRVLEPMYKRTDTYYQDNRAIGIQEQVNKSVATGMGKYGLQSNAETQDNEIQLYALKLQAATDYFNYLVSMNADEMILEEQRQKMMEATIALQDKMAAKIGVMQEWFKESMETLPEYGTALGEAFSKVDPEERADAFKEAHKAILKDLGETTKKMIIEWVKQRIQHSLQQQLMVKDTKQSGQQQFDAETTAQTAISNAVTAIGQTTLTNKRQQNTEALANEAQETTGEVNLNIAKGAAKTVGELGWWGIPLVAVITAVLNGLLAWAMGSLFKSKETKKTETPKTLRLASGMLVYDEGNIGNLLLPPSQGGGTKYLGTDGRSYAATATPTPEGTALVRHPIATMIGGQPALVGERGTELIIGRRTLRDMSQFRPDLLQQLYAFEKRRFRTYDEGNIGDVGSRFKVQGSSQDPQMQQTLQSLQQTVAMLSSTMEALQRNGIYAKINKYGAGGLVDEVADGLYTTKKRGNNTNVRRLFG